MRDRKQLICGIAAAACIAGLGAAALVYADNGGRRPPADQVANAQAVGDLMVNELVAALFQEFNETTPQNVEQGKQAISLIFNDLNRDMRLIGTFSPLLGGRNNRPSDDFEVAAQKAALAGQPFTSVEKVDGTWFFRRSVPLSNTFHKNCVLCHANFTADFFNSTNNPGQWVGALVVTVPIKNDD